jgi:formate/nitrite transporter FocA (FNT family)
MFDFGQRNRLEREILLLGTVGPVAYGVGLILIFFWGDALFGPDVWLFSWLYKFGRTELILAEMGLSYASFLVGAKALAAILLIIVVWTSVHLCSDADEQVTRPIEKYLGQSLLGFFVVLFIWMTMIEPMSLCAPRRHVRTMHEFCGVGAGVTRISIPIAMLAGLIWATPFLIAATWPFKKKQ